jgi:xanthine phosphoribosyltransferase
MKSLEEKILCEGSAIGTEIVKVDGFLNHQIDVRFMDEIGSEIAHLFANSGANKILTVEASGIAIACAASRAMDCVPVVFAKKAAPNTMTEGFYSAEARSFTKGTVSVLRVAEKYLKPGDRVLIVDDFLATGEAALAMAKLVRDAGAETVGFTAVIEKKWQGGGDKLRELGIEVKSLAVIAAINDGKITFADN